MGAGAPPAGHRVGLGEAGHGDGASANVRAERGETGRSRAVVGQVLVDLIRHHIAVVPERDGGDGLQLGARIDRAGGVGGRIDDNQAGARGDGGLQHRGREAETGSVIGKDDLRRRAGKLHHFGVADPERRGNDDLIAGRAHGEDGEVAGELAAGRDDDLRRRDLQSVVSSVFVGYGLAERLDAGRGGVFGLAGLERSDAGLLNVLGRVEIGLAGGEAAHVLAGGEEGFGFGVNGEGR